MEIQCASALKGDLPVHSSNTAFKSGLLKAQSQWIASLVPIVMFFNVVTAVLLLWMYGGDFGSNQNVIWITAFVGVFVYYFLLWLSNLPGEQEGDEKTPSKAFKNHKLTLVGYHVLALFHGAVWGWAAFQFGVEGSAEFHAVLTACFVIVISVGGMGYAAMPSAILLYVLPISLGIAVALWSLPASAVVTILFGLLALLTITTPLAAQYFSKLFKNQVSMHIEGGEKSTMVSMLLEELQRDSKSWVWETDSKGQLVRYPYDLFAELEIETTKPFERLLGDIVDTDREQYECAYQALVLKQKFENAVLKVKAGDQKKWLRLSGTPLTDSDGAAIRFVGTVTDITAEKLAEEQIEQMSQNDNLTGLMNRAVFTNRLEQSVGNLERYGRPFTILYMDLDGFKLINDLRGHNAGDMLLTEAGSRIVDAVGDEGSVARLGGDEFAVLLESQADAGVATRLATKLISKVSKSYRINGDELRVGLSMGIAIAPLNGIRPDQLLRNADLALYRAKADGRGVFRFFENDMDSELRERRILESELQDSVHNDELVLHFQPLVDSQTHKTVGMESLIRWQHPLRGMLSPIEFIVIAEQSNLICEIGLWTLKKACETAKHWPEDTFVAVNLSASHFMVSDIVAEVSEVLRETGLEASRLELEITESLLIHDSEAIVERLDGLKELGVSVAMDDFGTGYSSLSYLMNVPFDKLKIDKSFVDEVSVNAAGRKIVRMITTLAGELNLNVTAEGVETQEQAEYLAEIGCGTLQGYLFSKPMSEDQLSAYFLNSKKRELEKAEVEKWESDKLSDVA